MYPYEQGALDSLCGVYGIVNSARIVASLKQVECRGLFGRIVDYLD